MSETAWHQPILACRVIRHDGVDATSCRTTHIHVTVCLLKSICAITLSHDTHICYVSVNLVKGVLSTLYLDKAAMQTINLGCLAVDVSPARSLGVLAHHVDERGLPILAKLIGRGRHRAEALVAVTSLDSHEDMWRAIVRYLVSGKAEYFRLTVLPHLVYDEVDILASLDNP